MGDLTVRKGEKGRYLLLGDLAIKKGEKGRYLLLGDLDELPQKMNSLAEKRGETDLRYHPVLNFVKSAIVPFHTMYTCILYT